MRKAKAIYSELAPAGDLITITRVLAETQRQAEEWESFMVGNRGKGQVHPDGCWWPGKEMG